MTDPLMIDLKKIYARIRAIEDRIVGDQALCSAARRAQAIMSNAINRQLLVR